MLERLYLSLKYRCNLWRIEAVKGRPNARDWRILRAITIKRWGYRCCNCHSRKGRIDVHHIVPVGVGGTNRLSNLRPLCFRCHRLIHPWMKE